MRRITLTTKDTTNLNLVFALTGDFFANSRAIRQIDALKNKGVVGYILHLGSPDRPQFYRGFRVLPITRPPGRGPTFFWNTHKAFVKATESLSADVFHASDLYCLPALSKKAQHDGSKLVFDSRELYHHVESTVNKPISRIFWYGLQRFVLPKTDLVFTVSESIADFLERQFSISRPTVVANVPQLTQNDTYNELKDEFQIPANSFVVLHSGNIRIGRNCDILVRAIGEAHESVHLVFMGRDDTNGNLAKLASDLGLEKRVHFKAAVAPSDVVAWTRSADIGVTLLAKSCLNHEFALPNKLFEYLTAGIPVIGTNLTEMSRLIDSYDVGRVTELDPVKLGALIQEIMNAPSRKDCWKRNTTSVVSAYNWNAVSKTFLDAYDKVLNIG